MAEAKLDLEVFSNEEIQKAAKMVGLLTQIKALKEDIFGNDGDQPVCVEGREIVSCGDVSFKFSRFRKVAIHS